MFRPKVTQREWLVEDLDQIQRYFPGAEVLEATETPFDIRVQSLVKVQTYAQHRRERKVSGGMRAAGEQSDAGTRRGEDSQWLSARRPAEQAMLSGAQSRDRGTGARPSLKMNALYGVIL